MRYDKQKIEEKIEIIAKTISECDTKEIGILSGKAGFAIFISYYSKYANNDKYSDILKKLILDCFNEINEGYKYHTFCNGISGYLWSLNHLAKQNVIDMDDFNKLCFELDEFLYEKMIKDVKEGNYDYLHGAIGVGVYFLYRIEYNKNVATYIVELIDELEKLSTMNDLESLKWLSLCNYETGQYGYNLSLSHGIASIISFLSKVIKLNICTIKVKYLLDGAINYLIKNKQNHLVQGSYFPSWVIENIPFDKSRLAWCYGDLGIAIALYNVSKIINDSSLEKFALKVLLESAKRKDLQKEIVIDAGLCHGTAGIAHIYNRMFLNTGIKNFKETADYWFNETLKMAKFDDGLAGFKAYRPKKYGGWTNEYEMLEGVAGIGLAFISAVSDIEPTWDECLLLS